MFKITRNEANRTLILLALVLLPIVVLFTILATALACSEYWSLYRERQRLLRSGESGHTRRARSDVPCLSSSSESSKASTKRSESSDGDADTYMKPVLLREHFTTEIHLFLRQDNTAIPAAQPLHIAKQLLSAVSEATTTPSSESYAHPYAIPGRTPSDAIQSKGNIALGEQHSAKDSTKRGNFFRVAEALDFNKQRHSSPGPIHSFYRRRNNLDKELRRWLELTVGPQNPQLRPYTLPMPLPITSAKIDIIADAMKISPRDGLFTWAAVEISADVSNLDGDLETQIGCEVPLDIMILVDNSANVSPVLLKGARNIVLHLVSSLDILVDKLAIGCISADPEQNLQLLLPLSRSEDLTRVRTSKALYEASNLLLKYSSRGVLRHVFVITANSGIALSEMTMNISNRVRFHTISPEPVLGIWASKPMYGRHLSASFDDEAEKESVHASKENLRKIIRHLRFGLNPGVPSNLSIGLSGKNGCDIEAVLGETNCKNFRPGENWALLVKIRAISEAPKVFAGHRGRYESICRHGDTLAKNQTGNDVDHMIDQPHGLHGSSDRALAENIFTVSLKHSHSALSDSTAIKLENKCEITRFPRSNSVVGQKGRRAIHKDARELYDQEHILQGRTKPIHLSRHIDSDNSAGSDQENNSSEWICVHSPSHLSPSRGDGWSWVR
ncbi:hypothetical protein AJ78_03776 [Emergomyces pasteurianus Ep9510]|uniref:VWFA domain-containing protein n=1 Tax=Emergomyces pasteurianus Ep9510 TaxID=1447872 RepID=A0A1J9QIM6_9EURO|nr:hypothetical protein AJ78_03776 [Emergomyces pasteurianus Ep9510]